MVRQVFPLVKLSQIISLSSMCLSTASRGICPIIFPGTEMQPTHWLFQVSSFLLFFEMGAIFFLFPISMDSTQLLWIFKYHGKWLATASDNSLRILGCVILSPIDLCIQVPKVVKKHCRFQSWRRIQMWVTGLARKDAKICIKVCKMYL